MLLSFGLLMLLLRFRMLGRVMFSFFLLYRSTVLVESSNHMSLSDALLLGAVCL